MLCGETQYCLLRLSGVDRDGARPGIYSRFGVKRNFRIWRGCSRWLSRSFMTRTHTVVWPFLLPRPGFQCFSAFLFAIFTPFSRPWDFFVLRSFTLSDHVALSCPMFILPLLNPNIFSPTPITLWWKLLCWGSSETSSWTWNWFRSSFVSRLFTLASLILFTVFFNFGFAHFGGKLAKMTYLTSSNWLAQEFVAIVFYVTTPVLPRDLALPLRSFRTQALKSSITPSSSWDNTSLMNCSNWSKRES